MRLLLPLPLHLLCCFLFFILSLSSSQHSQLIFSFHCCKLHICTNFYPLNFAVTPISLHITSLVNLSSLLPLLFPQQSRAEMEGMQHLWLCPLSSRRIYRHVWQSPVSMVIPSWNPWGIRHPHSQPVRKNERERQTGRENERWGEEMEAIGVKQKGECMFLYMRVYTTFVCTQNREIYSRVAEKRRRDVCVAVCVWVCVCVCVCACVEEERGSFQSCQASPASRGEQKTVSWCRRLSAWQTLQFRAFSGVSGSSSHISWYGSFTHTYTHMHTHTHTTDDTQTVCIKTQKILLHSCYAGIILSVCETHTVWIHANFTWLGFTLKY